MIHPGRYLLAALVATLMSLAVNVWFGNWLFVPMNLAGLWVIWWAQRRRRQLEHNKADMAALRHELWSIEHRGKT